MTSKITIFENNVWAGTGNLMYTPNGGGAYFVADCPAELGSNSSESDSAYELIDRAVTNGESSATLGEHTWTWEISEE